MTEPSTTDSGSRAALSEEERAVAFATGAPRVPRRVLAWGFVALVVLGGGGALLERALGHTSLQSGASPPSIPATTVVPGAPGLSSTLPSFLNLVSESGKAPAFSLSNALGRPVSLSSMTGRVVVLSFFGARCSDICPVVAAEMKLAGRSLGASASKVSFLTINVDPGSTSLSDARLAGIRSGLSTLSSWQFLTAPLSQLNAVWTAYNIAVDYQPTTEVIAHTEAIYLIDQTGHLRYRLTPFANEATNGHYQLDAANLRRFGDGVATYASSLLRQASGT